MKEEATYPNPYTNYAKERLQAKQGVPSTESQILATVKQVLTTLERLDERFELANELLGSLNDHVAADRKNWT